MRNVPSHRSHRPHPPRPRRPALPSWAGAALLFALTALAAAPAAADALYAIEKADAKATLGVKNTTSVTISGRAGWHINEEAPITVKLTAEPGVTVEKQKLTKSDLAHRTPDRARFDVAFTATEPGRKNINAEASFVICQATACKPIKETIALAIDVAPPASQPAPSPSRAKTKKK